MSDTYCAVTVDLPEEEAELLQCFLHEEGVLGLEVRDKEAPPMPGVRGPRPGEAIVVAFFQDRLTAQRTQGEVEGRFPGARASLADVPNEDWSESWKSLIKSTQVGRLWVGPPWELKDAPKDKVCLTIEPKMAFGTGDHPTTSLCLLALDHFLQENPGASVLDVGTGTGILAMAARKLSASRVVGTDNDPLSLTLARENANLNGTPDVELTDSDPGSVPGTFDLVVANILANTLIELSPQISSKVQGTLLLAGVLSHQAEEVERAYVARGLWAMPRLEEGAWVLLTLSRTR